MKNWLPLLAPVVLSLALFGCGGGNDDHAGHDHAGNDHDHDHAADAHAATLTGKILETMDAGSYTYVLVDCGDQQVWAAAPQRPVTVGSEATIATAMPMRDFHSDTLDRTFEVVYFVNDFGEGAPAGGHGDMGMGGDMGGMSHPAPAPAADVDLDGIERAAGGKTVAEVWAGRQELAGSEVVVRGKVVKYHSGIMGRNWLHVRDGSGQPGSNDLTVTTQGFAQVGDLVSVTGTVAVDKDFGAGYRYDVIVENATVIKD